MFEVYRSGSFAGTPPPDDHNREARARIRASERYNQIWLRAYMRALWNVLLRRDTRLRSLPADQHYALARAGLPELRTVPIACIVGSENRSADFDTAFAPLGEHTEGRWINIALAWELGTDLPAVELLQLGADYYVRDGHHRISVARAYGLREIDAHVLVLQSMQPAGALEVCIAAS